MLALDVLSRVKLVLHCCGVLLLLLVTGCSSLLPMSPPRAQPVAEPLDPTPLAKCSVSASHTSPLVTEWPASEKAHLESLVAQRTVAVEYSGCELRIVDGCELPGQYTWQRTTLATDTIEIEDADELYAKLPIGAVGLEGELNRSGRLAVQTTVAGQLRAEGGPEAMPRASACRRATHFISAISVGSFRLLSGAEASGSGTANAGLMGGGVKAKRSESVLREAGARLACDETTDEAPNGQCASPIQLFLAPLGAKTTRSTDLKQFPPASEDRTGSDAAPSELGPRAEKPAPAPKPRTRPEGSVNVAFPAPADPDEVWTLRRPGGKFVCRLPCREWIGPASGYYLQREPQNGARRLKLDVSASFPHPVGSHVTAEFQAARGNATLAGLAMWVSVPTAAVGVGLITWGIVQSFQTCRDWDGVKEDCFPGGGTLIAMGLFEGAIGAAGIWWFTWSRAERFETHETLPAGQRASTSPGIGIGVGRVYGSF